jgi:hypothetical protein
MPNANEIIEMCFRGEGITPDNLKASEIADLITSYEDALLSIIARNNPEINLEEVFVSLIGIEENSVHLKFKPKVFSVVLAAAIVINSAIISNSIPNSSF